MSTRVELANRVRDYFDDERSGDRPDMLADALIAEGWRKKPDRDEVESAIAVAHYNFLLGDGTDRSQLFRMQVDAVLALMDRGQ